MEILHSISDKIKSILLVVKSSFEGKTTVYNVRNGIVTASEVSPAGDLEYHGNALNPML